MSKNRTSKEKTTQKNQHQDEISSTRSQFWTKTKAVLVGVTFIGMLFASIYWITSESNTTSLTRIFSMLFVALFIGLSTGHYVGKAIIEDGKVKKWVYLGAFGMLTLGGLLFWRISSLSLVLLLGVICVTLAHDTNFIENNDEIQEWTRSIAERISPVGITGIVVWNLITVRLGISPISMLQSNVNIMGQSVPVWVIIMIASIFWVPIVLALYEKFLVVFGVKPTPQTE